ncbi:protease complex subunit PrcB family protein [Flavobacterium sp. '19STA2R22 D10 B1']|uniref:protease complex subunit PrcB family protein n=1 Tax=Flavobacterium aerium TaxID=3037261 RepID=UPI00278C1756|nr:protease complex subunit PrcB family protein [Flavobacterium sp. '19STA2R22 D10 B1']
MKKFLLLSASVLLFACGGAKHKTNAKSAEPMYQILTESTYKGKEQKSYEIIETNAQLQDLYYAVEDSDIPKIDFNKEKVVALFLGQKNSGGYAIGIKSVVEKKGKIYVTVKKTSPKEGEMSTMAMTNPFCIAKIKSNKEIVITDN